MELSQVLQALRNADAAGDEEAARRLAQIAQQMQVGQPAQPGEDTKGFKAAAAAGLERLKGEAALTAGKLGLMDTAEAERYQKEREAAAEKRFTPTQEGWTESPWQKLKETAGGSVPYMIAPAAAGLAALAAPVSAPTAALLGAGAAGLASAGQFTGTNLARQLETGKTLEQADLGKAALAAIPQAALDTAAMALLPGVGKLFGSVGAKLSVEEAKAIASQTLGKTVADYAMQTGKAMGREGLTEAIQQVFERLQAGLSITDPQARKEYIDNFIGGAALGAVAAPVGRAYERGEAQQVAASAQAEESRKRRLEQAQAEDAAKAAEAEKAAILERDRQTPEYAMRLGDQYDTLLADYQNLKKQLKKPGKDATPEEQVTYKDLRGQVEDMHKQLTALTPEYQRTKALRAQGIEQARVAGLSPMDYLLENTSEAPESKIAPTTPDMAGYTMPEPVTPTMQRQAEVAKAAQVPAQYAAQQMQLAQDHLHEPTGAQYVEYLMQDPYKASLIVETKTPLPGLTANESSMIRNTLASQLKKQAKTELAGRQEELKAQVPGKVQGNPLEQFLADQDMLDVARQEGMTESEIAAMERMARMQRGVTEQGDLFGEQRVGQAAGVQAKDTIAEKLAELQKQLDIAVSQRNISQGGQYRESIRGLIEQIRDLQSKQTLPTIGGLGTKTADLQGALTAGTSPQLLAEYEKHKADGTLEEWYARLPAETRDAVAKLPEDLRQQQEAQAKRNDLLYMVAEKQEGAATELAANLVKEIEATRGKLKPETITEIENEVNDIVSPVARYGQHDQLIEQATRELDALSTKWRGGVERGQTFTREATPTETSTDMLRAQMDRAFAQNDQSTRTERREKYDPQDMALLNRIADNFAAFTADPERRNMAGEWLHRVTTTGVANPEVTNDLRNALDMLEQGKRSDTETPTRETPWGTATKPTQRAEQLELPSRMMPTEIEGKAPVQAAVTFDTAAEFQKFLASDGLKALRQEAGLLKDTVSRTHQRMELFRKKYTNTLNAVRAQMEVLNKRKAELEQLKGQEQRVAKELVADAEIRLRNVQERLDAELHEVQIAYIQASLQDGRSAAAEAEISQKIADNVAKFEKADARAVQAAQATADAKAELARIMQMPVSKKTFSSMRKAQQAVVAALQEQRSASGSVSARLMGFLNEDLRLQLDLAAAIDKKEADALTLVEAKQALDAEAAKQKRRVIYKKEFLSAQKDLAAALELSGAELAKITGPIDAELKEIEKQLGQASAVAREAEGKLAPKEAPKSAFEQKLAEVKVEPLTRAEQDAIAARDKAERDSFQAATARLAAIPGTRIDFSKRREMIEAFNAYKTDNAELEQKLKDVDTGIEEMQIAAAIAEEALADTNAGYSPEQKAKFKERLDAANERVAQLQAYGKQLEAQQAKMQAAYDKAVRATSTDPEVYQQVTKDLDARVEKLNKNIAENEARIAKGEAKSGGKAETQTLQQARKRLAQYKRELRRVEALRSNRLGITRINAVTGEKITEQTAAEKRAEQGKAAPQKRMGIETQEAIDAELERAQLYGTRKDRLDKLQKAQAVLQATKEPKSKAAKEARIEQLRKLQEDINKQIDLVNEVMPKGMGKISAAAREQSSAPGKFRTGTAESKAATGVTKQPIVEKRAMAQPTAAKAVEDANEFATRLEQAKDRKTLVAEAADKSLSQQAAILDALDSNVRRYTREVAKLEDERDTLQAAVDAAKENDSPIPPTTAERLKTVREQLANYSQALTRAQFAKADLEAVQEAAPTLEGKGVATVKGAEMKQPKMGKSFDRMASLFDDEDMSDTERLPQLAAVSASGPQLSAPVDTEQSAAAVMANIADTTTDPINKAIASRLKMLLGNTRVELVDDLKLNDGQPALGAATVDGLLIELDRRFGMGETTALHEGVHAATERVLRMPEDQLTESQLNAKRELEAIYEAVKNDPNFTHPELLADLSEFAAESMTNPVLRGYMQQQKWTIKYMWDAFKSAILKLLGVETPTNMSEAAIAAVDKLMTKVPRPTEADFTLAQAPATKLPRLASSDLSAALDTANRMVAKQRTFSDKIKANASGLAFETQLVDRFAGFEHLRKRMDPLKGIQMMYYLRMYDQRMNFVSQSAANGALQLNEKVRADGRKEYVIESQPGASLRGVAEILRGASGITGSVDNTSRLFTMYLAALRADRVGFEKLNFGKDISEAEVRGAMRSIEANKALSDVFKEARAEYNAYNEGLVRFAQRTGALSKETADALLSSKDYIPYYRERNGNVELLIGGEAPIRIGSIKEQPYLKDLVGGDTAILDFMTSSVQNTNMLTDMALRNLATKNAVIELVETGMAKITKAQMSGPDVVKFKVDGEDRYAMIDTDSAGVPSDLLVKGMEGIPTQMPAVLRLAAAPAKLLRKAVTLNPLYAGRQLFRDSLAAPLLAGADFSPVMGALREIGSPAGKTLERRGVVGGQIFTGTQEDLTAIMRRIASGKGGWQDWVSKFETVSMEADALTRRAQYNSYIKQGLSEMEATLMALESMNFNKRGASPSIHMANSLIPFFNAQIQSLNVLYKALTGKLPFNERLKIQEKLLKRGFMIAAGTLAYAAMMQDDEAYKNATPDQKYGNWFVRIPGVSEPVRLPIPFEIGYIFKALPEALYNSMTQKHGGEEAVKAFKQILLNVIPGGTSYGLPQAIRPAIEAGLGKSFYTGRDILSATEKGLLPEAQFRENTSELAKLVGKTAGVSPIVLEELVRGYTGTMGLAFLQAVSVPFSSAGSPEKAVQRLSDTPVVGSLFQPNDAGGIINATFDQLKEFEEVKRTVDKYIEKGEVAKAKALIAERGNEYAMSEMSSSFSNYIKELTQYETAIRASSMTPEEKRVKLDEVRRMKIRVAETVRNATDRTTRP